MSKKAHAIVAICCFVTALSEGKTDIYRRYYVYKYQDGTYRFAILVEITDPDY